MDNRRKGSLRKNKRGQAFGIAFQGFTECNTVSRTPDYIKICSLRQSQRP